MEPQTGLPSENEVADELERFLAQRGDWTTPSQAYEELAGRFRLSKTQRHAVMPDGRNHWENRVQFARRKLKDRGALDGSRHGYWKLSK